MRVREMGVECMTRRGPFWPFAPYAGEAFENGGRGLRDLFANGSRNDTFYKECSTIPGGGVRVPRPTVGYKKAHARRGFLPGVGYGKKKKE